MMSDDKKQQTDSLDWIKASADEADASSDKPVSGDIVLEGCFGIAEAETMHQHFSNVLDAHVDISIQSEALSRVDAAGVQLLYALVKEAEKRSIALKWLSVSDALQEASASLGLIEGMGFEVSGAA